jgi:hypothetical protein
MLLCETGAERRDAGKTLRTGTCIARRMMYIETVASEKFSS